MEKLKIQDLEVGKVYSAFYKGVEHDGFYKVGNSGKLFYTDGTEWEKSDICYNEILDTYFVEFKEGIDWSKVPRGTKVQVRDCDNEKWKNAYFLELGTEDEYPFRVSFSLDDNFTEFKMEHRTNCFDYCRIHESVEIPDEWYKEVE